MTFTNSEAAFQSEKTLEPYYKSLFCSCSPAEAKKLGRQTVLRPDWEAVKVNIMRSVLDAKFSQNEQLKQALLATGERPLIEGNNWNDRFWGAVMAKNGMMEGQNMLGRLLMSLRSRLRVLQK